MKSIKCPQCGLVYWSTDPNCKRCGLLTAASSSPASNGPPPQQQVFAPTPPIVNYAYHADEAMLKRLKSDSIFFYVIGGIQILLWFIIGHLMIVDGVLNITLSFLVYKFKSRVAALFLFGLTLLAILGAVVSVAQGTSLGMIFPVGVIIRLLASCRMVQAAFKLHGYVQEGPPKFMPPPPPNFYPEAAPQWTPANTSPELHSGILRPTQS
jgi:hypothetical protein